MGIYSCPNCGEYRQQTEDKCNKCNYDFVFQQMPDGKKFDQLVGNDSKSLIGAWYPFQAKFKIERAKDDTSEHPNKHEPFVLTITLPDNVRKGFYPRDFRLASEDGKSTSYYYNGWNEDKLGVKRLKQRIKDLQRWNRVLTIRNQALEKHFTKTSFEERFNESKESWHHFDCDYCGKPIDTKRQIEGQDFIRTEDGGIHIKCTPMVYNSICHNCSLAYSIEAGECEECGEKLDEAKSEEILTFFIFDAIKKHLPEELRDKVKFIKRSKMEIKK